MKTILVPHDFSACADNALNQAIYLAAKTGAELHIYHVAALHPYWKQLSSTDQDAYRENLKESINIRERLKERMKIAEQAGVSARTSFTPGQVIEGIVEYSRKYDADLLVIGTHGMKGMREWILGSNTQKILRQVECPVLAIKHDLVYRDFKRIAFVSAYRKQAEEPFHKLLDFAGIFQSEIVLINMDEPGFFSDPLLVIRQAMREYQDLAKSRGFHCEIKRLTGGNLEEGLRKHIVEEDIDLVVIPTHGKGAIARIFSSSIAEAIVNHFQKPVMTIRI
jgi:nucleotide-binding universal stress UspA family protein